jgi:diguanylate cyclase (GGDEF)-like protein
VSSIGDDRGEANILVVEDDPQLRVLVGIMLEQAGFTVELAAGGYEAFDAAVAHQPDVIVTDIMMPDGDGMELCRRLRSHPKTRYLCIIMLTAKAGVPDRVEGLRAGADDFVTKPFDPDELVERVRRALRRTREMAALSPLSGLPGNLVIRDEIEQRLQAKEPFALMHIDLDNFKAFNDRYGILRGDDAIHLMSECIQRAVEGMDPAPFLGHVGGDDMVVVIDADASDATAERVIRFWDEGAKALYDQADLEAGYIVVSDRDREKKSYPIMTVSIGVATTEHRDVDAYQHISYIAARMKEIAKRQRGSAYETDRRYGALRETERVMGDLLREIQTGTRTVLVVDDDVEVQALLTAYLEEAGFEVVQAHDGVEAYQQARTHRPAFIVLDHRMPRLNGQFTAELMREILPESPIIAVSGVLLAAPKWADGFLEKAEASRLPELLETLGPRSDSEFKLPF